MEPKEPQLLEDHPIKDRAKVESEAFDEAETLEVKEVEAVDTVAAPRD